MTTNPNPSIQEQFDISDKVSRMFMKLPVVYDWYRYKGEVKFVSANYEESKRVGRPMMDLHYCATKAMNNIVEKTVQFDKNKFSPR